MASMLSGETSIPFTKARSVVRELFKTTADIIPDYDAGTLLVKLHSMTTVAENKKVGKLLEELNHTETTAPGTSLTLFFGITGENLKISRNGIT